MHTDGPLALDVDVRDVAAPLTVERPRGGDLVPASDGDLLSTEEVAALAGVTYRQVDFWVRRDILAPAVPADGSGTRRQFTRADARLAWLVGQLQALRIRNAGIVSAVAALRDLRPWEGLLVTDGQTCIVAEHAADLLDAIDALGPSVTVVNLDACPDFGGGSGA